MGYQFEAKSKLHTLKQRCHRFENISTARIFDLISALFLDQTQTNLVDDFVHSVTV